MKNIVLVLFLFTASLGFSQQAEYVDFKTAKAHIVFGDLSKKEVTGTITYEFEILKAVDSIFIDAKKVAFSNIVLHGLGVQADVEFHNDSNRLII